MFLEKFWSKEPCSPVSRNPFFMVPVQVKSIKDWNNIIDKLQFTPEDFKKHFEVIKKLKIHFSDETTLITILDNLSYYLDAFILKRNPLPFLLNNNNILPFLSLWVFFVFLFVCLTCRVLVFLFFAFSLPRS